MKKYKIAITPHEFCRENECTIYRDTYVMTFDAENKKQEFISRIPNQIKSILLGADTRINKNWFDIVESEGKDIIKSPSYTGLKYFNYSHINVIEVLVGFEQDRLGNTEI